MNKTAGNSDEFLFVSVWSLSRFFKNASEKKFLIASWRRRFKRKINCMLIAMVNCSSNFYKTVSSKFFNTQIRNHRFKLSSGDVSTFLKSSPLKRILLSKCFKTLNLSVWNELNSNSLQASSENMDAFYSESVQLVSSISSVENLMESCNGIILKENLTKAVNLGNHGALVDFAWGSEMFA